MIQLSDKDPSRGLERGRTEQDPSLVMQEAVHNDITDHLKEINVDLQSVKTNIQLMMSPA